MYRNTAAFFVIRSVFFRGTNVESAFMTPELLTLMTRKLGNSNEFATRQDVFEIVLGYRSQVDVIFKV